MNEGLLWVNGSEKERGSVLNDEIKFRLGELIDQCQNSGLDRLQVMALFRDALNEKKSIDQKAEMEHFNNEYQGFADKISTAMESGQIDRDIENYLINIM